MTSQIQHASVQPFTPLLRLSNETATLEELIVQSRAMLRRIDALIEARRLYLGVTLESEQQPDAFGE